MLKTIKIFDNNNNKKLVYDKTFDSWDVDLTDAIFDELERKLDSDYANADVDSPIEFEAKFYETEDNEESEDYAIERYIGSEKYYCHPWAGIYSNKESCESAMEMYKEEL